MKKKMLSVLLSGTLVFGITFAPVQAVFADEPLLEREPESEISVHEEQTEPLTASDEREQIAEQPTMRAEKKAPQKQSVQSGTVEKETSYRWTLDQEGTLTVTGGDDWIKVSEWDFEEEIHDSIVKIVISEGVTDLSLCFTSNEEDRFSKFKELKLPTSLNHLDGTLEGANHLETVTGGGNVSDARKETFWGTKWGEQPGFVTLGKTLLGYNGEVKELNIPDGVETIGGGAFRDNKKLQSITIPKSVTDIGCEAFAGCSALTEIKGGENVRSCSDDVFDGVPGNNGMIILGDELKWYNGNAEEVKIPDRVKTIGSEVFANHTTLKKVTIPDSVTDIEWGAFAGCSQLADVIGGKNVSYVADDAFDGVPWNGGLIIFGTKLFTYEGNEKSVVIPDGVETIGGGAFRDNQKLQSITIPKSVTDIGWEAFAGCSALTEIKGGENVRSCSDDVFDGVPGNNGMIILGDELKWYNGNAEEVKIPDGVKTIGWGAFAEHTTLKKVTIPDSVTDIESEAFAGCSQLADVIGGKNVSYVADDAFHGILGNDKCLILGDTLVRYNGKQAEITIPNGVETIGAGAFSGVKTLKKITLPDSVRDIGEEAFLGCSALTDVQGGKGVEKYHGDVGWNAFSGVPWNGGLVVFGTKLFVYGGSEKSVVIPDGVEVIDRDAFCDNQKLQSITIPKSVTEIDRGAFAGCSQLADVIGGKNVSSVADDAFNGVPWMARTQVVLGKVYLKYNGNDASVVIPDGVAVIADGAFRNNTRLQTVTIPDSTVFAEHGAFEGCSQLAEVKGGLNLSYMGSVFAGTQILEKNETMIIGTTLVKYVGTEERVVIPDGIERIQEGAFRNNKKLKSITIPNTVVSIGTDAFSGCSALTEINGGKGIGAYHYGLEKAFDGVPGNNGFVILGNELIKYNGTAAKVVIPAKVKTIGRDAFSGNKTLKSITIPDSVKAITGSAFDGCASLEEVIGADSLTCQEIEYAGFGGKWIKQPGFVTLGNKLIRYNGNEKKVVIPNGIEAIGDRAFAQNTTIESVTIPDSVNYIGLWAFEGCTSLKNITGAKNVEVIRGGSCFEQTPWMNEQKGMIVFGKILLKYTGSDSAVTIPKGVQVIGSRAFSGNQTLKSITIPDSVKTINAYAFNGCRSLSNVAGGENVSDIGFAVFNGTPWMKQNDKAVILGKYLLAYNGTSSELILPKNVEAMAEEVFAKNETLTSVKFSGNVKVIPRFAFANCKNLKKIELPDSVTNIAYGAFDHCGALTSIKLPSHLESIGTGAFISCNALSDVQGSEDSLNLKSIECVAFAGCNKLKSLTIPKGVTAIGVRAFGYDSFEGDWQEIEWRPGSKMPDAVIYGIKGTDAEQYAKANQITFKEKNTNKVNLSDVKVTASIGAQTYTGNVLTPPVTVKYGTKVLKKDTDYTVSYKNNINPGKATVTITGKGNYTGTKTLTFTIAEGTVSVKSSTNTAGKPQLTWSPVKGASKYVIYRSGSSTGTYKKMHTTTGTSYTNTSAGAGYTYFYKVQALDKNGKAIAKSSIVKQKCITAVLTVKGGNSDSGKPRLTWSKMSGASKYVIYRSGTSTGTYKKMHTTTGTSYTNTSASGGYTYFYKVQALDKNGKVIAKSSTVKQLCKLSKPKMTKGNNSAGKPKLTWSKVSGASKYVIYRSGYSNGTYKKMYTTTGTSYTNTSAGAGYTYYYKVVAVSKNNTNANATSQVVKQKCLSSGVKITKGNAKSGKPKLSWKKVSGAKKYEVYRSGYKNGTYTKMYTTEGTSYTNTSAKKGSTYYYKVKAIGTDTFVESNLVSVKCK